MPCRDWDDTGTVYVDRQETVDKLCEAYRTLEKHGINIPSAAGRAWWEAHKKEDAAKKRAEEKRLLLQKKKKYILSKLTEEEQRILGLYKGK